MELMKPNWVGNWTGKHHLWCVTDIICLPDSHMIKQDKQWVCLCASVCGWATESDTLLVYWARIVDLFQILSFSPTAVESDGGDFQPEKSWRVREEMISSAAVAVMITVHHLKQITNLVELPACLFTHYTWLDRVTVNNYLARFS